MHREEMEQLLVGYLYGELSAEERTVVEERLAADREWADALAEMRRASGLLRRWETSEPGVRFVFAQPSEGVGSGRRERFSRLRRTAIWPAAIAAAALLLLVLNTRVQVDEGRFQLSFGRAPSPTVVAGEEEGEAPGIPLEPVFANQYVDRDMFLRSQAELIRFVATLIRESEDRQRTELVNTLGSYAREAQVQREGDLLFVDHRLDAVEGGTQDILRRVQAGFPPSLER